MGRCRDEIASGTDGPYLGPERDRVVADISQAKKDRLKADIRATNILLHGLTRDIYKLINHNTDAKDIWDNVKMLLEGSELTKDDRESQLYDEFEHFGQHKGENIHDYYVRFTKLINDTRHIKMTMPKIQLNSKYVNNMLPEWGRFVTAVKLNKGLKESNHDQLYAYLKQHELHANENKMQMERLNQHSHDPLALVSNVSPYQYPSSSSVPPQPSYIPPVTYQPYCLLAQQYKTQFPQTNNRLRTSSNTRNQATLQNGRVVVQNVQGRLNRVQGNNARGTVAPGNGRAQYRAGNVTAGKIKPIKCYNCNGIGHIARNCNHHKTLNTLNNVHGNLSFVNPIYDEADPSYDSDTLSEDNEDQVIHSDVSFVPNDVVMIITNDIYKHDAQCVTSNNTVNASLTVELARYKELAEDTLEIVETTRKQMIEKMKDPECVKKKVKIAPHDYSKENYLATFTPQKQLTPEQIFWSDDLLKRKAKAIKEKAKSAKPITAMTVYPPNTPTKLVPKVLPTKSQ
nr:hypothetical protein [Tanacetum cinerariifolium]